MSEQSGSGVSPVHSGLGTINADRFDAAAAVGGWRGVLESIAPTLMFVCVLALRPQDLAAALLASLTVSAAALAIRLSARQPLTQVLGGVAAALVSALWAWRSGSATNFYATGLVINAVWLAVTGGSLLLRRPLVGLFVRIWRTASGDGHSDSPQARRRYGVGTGILAGMFLLRLTVELPLYLAGEAAVGALGLARLALGVPLFALTLWFVWQVVNPVLRPTPVPRPGS
ncbi:DUF3159 domain-containing protein [Actinomyces qiguomingii]|uniref:DUF3159 domain-containing protein n=1 Tax=Actinomyces qiguomingii TaxID=2057800 RepID=UPI000CA015AA|nr:DUF3159 domain-containing protein [Actinomyces qiguomingii]